MRASNDFGASHYGIQTIKNGFDCRYLELLNACILRLIYIVLNVRDGIESEYPSIVSLSIVLNNSSWILDVI